MTIWKNIKWRYDVILSVDGFDGSRNIRAFIFDLFALFVYIIISTKWICSDCLSFYKLTKAVDISPAGRISHFLVYWQKLTLNQDMLSVVKGYTIPLIKILFQQKISNFTRMNKKQLALVNLELKEMSRKGAIKRTQSVQGEILSNLFLVWKKDGYRPVISLKMLSQFIPFLHFQMEGLSQLKQLIQEEDWMWKLDLKDAYFSVPLDRNSRKFKRFQWKGTQ